MNYIQSTLKQLRERYPFDFLQFEIGNFGTVYTQEFLDKEFFNDSPSQRTYGSYLFIHNKLENSYQCIPLIAFMGIDLLCTLIDVLFMEVSCHEEGGSW